MANSRQLHRIATRPADYIRFATTGRMPEGKKPQGPLVELLKKIAPHDLAAIKGVTVDHRLGYTGSRRFQYASQAWRWIAPAEEVFDAFPAESWRDKRFLHCLYLEDFAQCCSHFPEQLFQRYRTLCRPKPKADNSSR
jgi:hypothetical protein